MAIVKIDSTGILLVLTAVPGFGVQLVADGKLMGILRKPEVDNLIAALRTASTLATAAHQQ